MVPGDIPDWKQVRSRRPGTLYIHVIYKAACVCAIYECVSIVMILLQRDVTYEEAKQFADENGRSVQNNLNCIECYIAFSRVAIHGG